MIAKTAADGNVSEYDSWTDLEENFAKAYEPIPLSIEMTDWLKMSKYDILKNVKSQKIRKDFEYMSKSEILVQVWSLTQLYSVDFSQSRISVRKCVFNKCTIKVCVSCP